MYIELDNNHISLVAYNAFVGIENVFLNLNFTSNNLTSLPQALLTLKNLFGLYLGLNPLLNLDSSTMQHIGPGITELELSMAFISTWPIELKMFSQMGWLVFYDLKRNILPTNSFAGFEHTLYYLAVIGGDLASIPCSFTMNSVQITISFQHLTNINSPQVLETCLSNYTAKFNKLTLINGSLREFPDLLSYMPNLVELDLSYNQIAFVNDSFIPLSHKIEVISLNNNLLAVFPNGLLKLTSLRELNLENNKIATLPAVLQIRPANSHYLRVCVSGNPAENSPEIQQQTIHIVGCISYTT
jgi:Leucine-rich repeat (LRR) protein